MFRTKELAAIIVTHPELTSKKKSYDSLSSNHVEYVKSTGTVIFGCMLSNFARPLDFKIYLKKKWGLLWTSGDYKREVYQLNSSMHEGVREAKYRDTVCKL